MEADRHGRHPDPAARRVGAAYWQDPDAFGFCLLLLLLDAFGPRTPGETHPLDWALDTWFDEARDHWGVEVPQVNRHKLAAAALCLKDPHGFATYEPTFHDVLSGLAGEYFEPGLWHPLTARELARGLAESHVLDPRPKGVFSGAVCRYANMVCRADGFARLPAAVAAFGVTDDPWVWKDLVPPGLGDDPDLAAAFAQGAAERDRELSEYVKGELKELASHLASLPVPGADREAWALLQKLD